MQNERTIDRGRTHIIYDPTLLPQTNEQLFDPAALERLGLLERRTTGRQSAFVFRINGRGYVLRHYWRGGLVGRAIDDTYFWTGLVRSRPLREWRLTRELAAAGLPVPQPVAARVVRRGLFYHGDLITAELPGTMTLADRLAQASLSDDVWEHIAVTIAKLHMQGAYHSDLNARNILLDKENAAYVIDWDKGQRRQPLFGWQQKNIARLLRSLEKISKSAKVFNYTTAQGLHLLAVYQLTMSKLHAARKTETGTPTSL